MENIYTISLMLDFYGQLLTKRQYEMLDLHYNSDFSLGEIAEQLDISRQGVFDNIRRAKAILYEFEEKLRLVARFSEQKVRFKSLLQDINSIDLTPLEVKDKDVISKVKEGIISIIDGI